MDSAVGTGAEEIVLRLLYQLIAILLTTRVVVAVVKRLGQTAVSGEILAGLLLGPSLLGALAPGLMRQLFHPSTSTIFVGIAQVGLVLLMFQIGLEFEFSEILRTRKRAIAIISVLGMVAPFVLGLITAPFFYAELPAPLPPRLGFTLFFAIAMSITAIPILGRIFMELRLSHTTTAALTIGAAAIDDVMGWLLLGVVGLVVREQFSAARFVLRIAGLALYLALIFGLVRPFLQRYIRGQLSRGPLQPPAVAALLLVLFASASITSNLGVFAIIGGFVIGVSLHSDRAFVAEWKARVSPLVNTLFLPVFFAYTGLRTDVGSLGDGRQLLLCAAVCAVAFLGKFGGAYAGARLAGESNTSALTIGACMNTRALMELIALNIGYDLGVLPRTMFTKLVVMAIASTFMATPLIRRLMRGQERSAREPGPLQDAAVS